MNIITWSPPLADKGPRFESLSCDAVIGPMYPAGAFNMAVWLGVVFTPTYIFNFYFMNTYASADPASTMTIGGSTYFVIGETPTSLDLLRDPQSAQTVHDFLPMVDELVRQGRIAPLAPSRVQYFGLFEGTKAINVTLDRSCSLQSSLALTVLPSGAALVGHLLRAANCTEYLLLKTPTVPASGVNQSAFSFKFEQGDGALRAEGYSAVGMLGDAQWATPPALHNLPAQLVRVRTLQGALTFTTSWFSLARKLAACFAVVFGDPARPALPTSEVLVCPHWEGTFTDFDEQLADISVAALTFRSYVKTSCQVGVCTKTYSFMATTPTKNVSLDLLPFLGFVLDYAPALANEPLLGLRAGCRVYFGYGKFTFVAANLTLVADHAGPQQPPAPDPLASRDAPVDCYAPGLGSNCVAGASVYVGLRTLLSLPNVALLVRMLALLRVVDDLSYYVYHRPDYSHRFRQIARFCWNVTNTKWVLPPLDPAYQEMRALYARNLSDLGGNSPATYQWVGEGASFLRQTDDYWICTAPLTVGTFALLFLLHRACKRTSRLGVLRKLLFRFEWCGFLVVSLIGENTQYLSFRCFSQLYEPNSQAGLVVAYLVLFLLTCYGVGAFLLLPITFRQHSELLLEGYHNRLRISAHLTLLQTVRFAMGFVHSLLFRDHWAQIGVLLLCHSAILGTVVSSRDLYKRKSLFLANLLDAGLKVLLHLLLACEVVAGVLLEAWIEATVLVLFLLCVCDLLLDNFVSEHVGATPAQFSDPSQDCSKQPSQKISRSSQV